MGVVVDGKAAVYRGRPTASMGRRRAISKSGYWFCVRSRANLIWRMTFSANRCPSRIDVRDMLRGVMRRWVDPADISVRPAVDQIDPPVAGMAENHYRRPGHVQFHDGFADGQLLQNSCRFRD